MATAPRVAHKKRVDIPDSDEAADSGQLLPSDWNDDHELIGVAGIDSPAFLNAPTAPTPPRGEVSDRLATMAALNAQEAPKRKTLVDAGDYLVPADVGLVIAKKSVPAPFAITLPPSTELVAEVVTVKDRGRATGGGASAYPVTIFASAGETIDGEASVQIDVDNMAVSFRKIRNDAGDMTGEGYERI